MKMMDMGGKGKMFTNVDFLTAVWCVCYTLANGDKISVRVPGSAKSDIERAVLLSKSMMLGYFESSHFEIDIEHPDGTFYSATGTVVVNVESALYHESIMSHYVRDENGDIEFNGIKYSEDKNENDNEGEDK